MRKIKVICWVSTLDQVVARLEECGFIKSSVNGPMKRQMMICGLASKETIKMLTELGGKGIIVLWVFDE